MLMGVPFRISRYSEKAPICRILCVVLASLFLIFRLSSSMINARLAVFTFSSVSMKIRSLMPILSLPTMVNGKDGCHFWCSASASLLTLQGHIYRNRSHLCALEAARSKATFVFPVPISMNKAPTLSRDSLLIALCCKTVFSIIVYKFR